MTDYVYAGLLSLAGVCILIVSVVILAVRGKGDRAVSWHGLGVTFEIKPCNRCPIRKG